MIALRYGDTVIWIFSHCFHYFCIYRFFRVFHFFELLLFLMFFYFFCSWLFSHFWVGNIFKYFSIFHVFEFFNIFWYFRVYSTCDFHAARKGRGVWHCQVLLQLTNFHFIGGYWLTPSRITPLAPVTSWQQVAASFSLYGTEHTFDYSWTKTIWALVSKLNLYTDDHLLACSALLRSQLHWTLSYFNERKQNLTHYDC